MATNTTTLADFSAHQRNPNRMPFYFTLDGASDPSDFSSNLQSVTRQTSAGSYNFYRCKLAQASQINNRASSWASIAATDGELVWATIGQGLVPSGGSAADSVLEFDVVVFQETAGTTASTIGLTGNVVSGEIAFDGAQV